MAKELKKPITLKVDVFTVGNDRKPVKLKTLVLDAKRFGLAKREARAKLESEGLYVRALSRHAESGNLIAYVAKQRPDARERGKPVVHTGIVGKGRQIRGRSAQR